MPGAPRHAIGPARPGSRHLADVVGENVKSYRLLRRLTQDELAARMRQLDWPKWTQPTVAETEKGRRDVKLGELLGLALVLDVMPGDLVDPTGVDGRDAGAVDYGLEAPLPAAVFNLWMSGRIRLHLRCSWGWTVCRVEGQDAAYEQAMTVLAEKPPLRMSVVPRADTASG